MSARGAQRQRRIELLEEKAAILEHRIRRIFMTGGRTQQKCPQCYSVDPKISCHLSLARLPADIFQHIVDYEYLDLDDFLIMMYCGSSILNHTIRHRLHFRKNINTGKLLSLGLYRHIGSFNIASLSLKGNRIIFWKTIEFFWPQTTLTSFSFKTKPKSILVPDNEKEYTTSIIKMFRSLSNCNFPNMTNVSLIIGAAVLEDRVEELSLKIASFLIDISSSLLRFELSVYNLLAAHLSNIYWLKVMNCLHEASIHIHSESGSINASAVMPLISNLIPTGIEKFRLHCDTKSIGGFPNVLFDSLPKETVLDLSATPHSANFLPFIGENIVEFNCGCFGFRLPQNTKFPPSLGTFDIISPSAGFYEWLETSKLVNVKCLRVQKSLVPLFSRNLQFQSLIELHCEAYDFNVDAHPRMIIPPLFSIDGACPSLQILYIETTFNVDFVHDIIDILPVTLKELKLTMPFPNTPLEIARLPNLSTLTLACICYYEDCVTVPIKSLPMKSLRNLSFITCKTWPAYKTHVRDELRKMVGPSCAISVVNGVKNNQSLAMHN